MDFAAFFNPEGAPGLPAGTNRGGFWEVAPPDCSVAAPMYNGSGVEAFYTCHHYDTTVSESRIATYLGIANGSIPPTALYGTHRTMPPGCDWAWQEQLPTGTVRTYDGLRRLGGRLLLPRHELRARAGAAACSRRSCPTCSCPRRSGARVRGD